MFARICKATLLTVTGLIAHGRGRRRGGSLESRLDAALANPQLKGASISLDVREITSHNHDSLLLVFT